MEKEKKKVLIVDDDVSIGEMLQTLLEFNGYKADVVNNHLKIDQKIKEGNFDLVLLDMRLSGVSGTDICTKLKTGKTTKEIPILMMSALTDAGKTCKAAGADDFVSKPFEMAELLTKIESLEPAQS